MKAPLLTLCCCALLGACTDGNVTPLVLANAGTGGGGAGVSSAGSGGAGAGGSGDARLCPGEPFGLGDPEGERMLVANVYSAIDTGNFCVTRALTSDFGAHCDALSIAGALAFAGSGTDAPPFASPGWHSSNPPDGSSRAWWATSAEGDAGAADISIALLANVPTDFCMRRASYHEIGASHVNRAWVVMFRN